MPSVLGVVGKGITSSPGKKKNNVLNYLFLGPDQLIKFVNEMFLFILKDHVFDHVSCKMASMFC